MNLDEKIKEMKELEQQFLLKVEEIRKEYAAKIRDVIASAEQDKIAALKKDLGI